MRWIPFQTYLALLSFDLLCFADVVCFFFKQIESLWQLCVEKSISAIFPTTFAHIIFLRHILIILMTLQTL